MIQSRTVMMSSSRRSRILALWILAWLPAAAALVIIPAMLMPARAAEPSDPPEVDHQLLKQLDEQLAGKQSGEVPAPRRPDGSPGLVAPPPTATKGVTDAAAASPAPQPKTARQDSTDEQLFKDLDAGDEKVLPPQ